MAKSATTHAFSAPPIWEVAISVTTQGPGVFNAYDVRTVHDLFREHMPNAEQQGPFPGIAAPFVQLPLVQMQQMQAGPGPSRWWFVSPGGENLLQVQEDMIARNWRRLAPPPTVVAYPGFEAIYADFRLAVEKLRAWNEGAGRRMPDPGACELLYDNLIPLEFHDGRPMRFSEAIVPVTFDLPLVPAGFNMSWFEPIGPPAPNDRPTLQIMIANVVIPAPDGSGLKAFAKLTFVARLATPTWDLAYKFIEAAHERLRVRLTELTTDDCRVTWVK